MAVSKTKRRVSGGKTRKKVIKPRSAPAKALADARYRKRVVKSAKAYRRKGRTKTEVDEDL
jgi:hypothetical protein